MNAIATDRYDQRRILEEHPLFRGMKRSMLKRLAAAAEIVEHPKGHVICRQGHACEKLFILLSGRCSQTRLEHDAEPVTSALLPGAVIGRREVMTDGIYRATVTVASQAAFLTLPAEQLALELREGSRILRAFAHPEFGTAVLAEERQRKRLVAIGVGLGRSPHASEITAALSRLVGKEPLLVRIAPGDSGTPSLGDWLRCRNRDERFCFQEHLKGHGNWQELRLHWSPQAGNPTHIADLFGHFQRFFPYVLIEVDLAEAAPSTIAFLSQADLAYVYSSTDESNLAKLAAIMDEANRAVGPGPTHWTPVIDRAKPWPGTFGDLANRLGVPGHSILAFGEGIHQTAAHARTVTRGIAGRRIGLALSSGAAKGLAHIGCVQVLEENGIEVDVVAGTSMGAYVGACWCAGHDGSSLARLAGSVRGFKGLMSLADPLFPPRVGFFRGAKAEKRLAESIRQARFEDLDRPLHIVATDRDTLARKIFSSGPVASAAHASFAMPGVMVPVEIDGRRYTDGAVCDPLPVDVLEMLGIERIIAVSVTPSLEDLANPSAPASTASKNWLRVTGSFLNRHCNYFAPGNVLDTVMNALEAAQARLCEQAALRADVYINAYPSGSAWYMFDQHARYIEIGRQAAELQLPALRQLANADSRSWTPNR